MCDNVACDLDICEIPYGYCHCGCGMKTNMAKQTISKKNIKKGMPLKFIKGHSRNIPLPPKACKNCGKFFVKEDCNKISDFKVQKFCSSDCYHEWVKGENHYNWKGGIRLGNKDGYLRNTEGRFIHRMVMEEFLGRPLTIDEQVHHIDGDKTNNKIENLIVFNSNSEHRKFEVKKQKRGKDGRFEA